MTDAPPAPPRINYFTAGVTGGLALGLCIILYTTVGSTLGLFFGGVVIVTLVLPPMVLWETSFWRQGFIASAVNDAVGIVWLVAAIRSPVTLLEWLQCYLLLASYTFALWGLVRSLRTLRIPPIPASALSITTALFWLTWPIWLARALTAALVDWLAPAHPLLALNGVLTRLGIWTEHAIAYRHLTNLGQDVPYQLPESILAGVFVHVIAGGVFFAIASLRPEG